MFEKIFGKKKEKKSVDATAVTSKIKTVECSHGDACTCESGKEAVDVVLKPSESPSQVQSQEIQQEKPKEIPPLTFKEMKALKRSRYQEDIMNNTKFKKAYLLVNKKTGQMAEIRAASSCHACNIIGWKHNHVRLISERDVTEKEPETTGSSHN